MWGKCASLARSGLPDVWIQKLPGKGSVLKSLGASLCCQKQMGLGPIGPLI